MSNLRKRDPTREEIDAILDAIQARWTDDDRQRRARGRHDDAGELRPPWEAPQVAISLPDPERS